jgi:hypothetical protein
LQVAPTDLGPVAMVLSAASHAVPGEAIAGQDGQASPVRPVLAQAAAATQPAAPPLTTTTWYPVFPVTAVIRPGRGGCSG